MGTFSDSRGTMEKLEPSSTDITTERAHPIMLLIVVALLVVMALAGFVAVVAASPERGASIPRPVRVSDRMTKLRDRIEP